MVETYLDNWERASCLATIEDATKMLEWRYQLAKGNRKALHVSQEVNFKSGSSQVSLDCQCSKKPKATNSQELN